MKKRKTAKTQSYFYKQYTIVYFIVQFFKQNYKLYKTRNNFFSSKSLLITQNNSGILTVWNC